VHGRPVGIDDANMTDEEANASALPPTLVSMKATAGRKLAAPAFPVAPMDFARAAFVISGRIPVIRCDRDATGRFQSEQTLRRG
jgi:hypothetical protein